LFIESIDNPSDEKRNEFVSQSTSGTRELF
jgi:hypothetical protein